MEGEEIARFFIMMIGAGAVGGLTYKIFLMWFRE
jgi:hypothetical protein